CDPFVRHKERSTVRAEDEFGNSATERANPRTGHVISAEPRFRTVCRSRSAAVSHGLNADRLRHLKSVIADDIAKDLYFGGAMIVARHGEIGFYEAFGHADSKRTIPVRKDSVFSLFSVTKSFTNVLVLRAIETGQFAFHTRTRDVVPEFAGKGRDDITVLHLLTHSPGMPPIYTPNEGMYIDVLQDMVMAICERVAAEHRPNDVVAYSALVSHAMLGYMLVRTDPKGRRFRDIMNADLLFPLGL